MRSSPQRADVAAGVKQQLQADAARLGGVRLLPGRFMVIEQAMGVPSARGDGRRRGAARLRRVGQGERLRRRGARAPRIGARWSRRRRRAERARPGRRPGRPIQSNRSLRAFAPTCPGPAPLARQRPRLCPRSPISIPAVAALVRRALSPRRPTRRRAPGRAIRAGRHTLVAAPTGSGKTLAAFLAAIDGLVRRGLEPGGLPTRRSSSTSRRSRRCPTTSTTISRRRSPASAPSSPRSACPTSRSAPRCAPATRRSAERQQRMRKRPPHILVTTPESLYFLLGSERGRRDARPRCAP